MPKKILIVEDNNENLKLFKLLITTMGYEAITAVNGEEGLEMARTEKPDIILMDIQMPVMDGITAFKKLRSEETTKSIPVVALTAYAMDGDKENFFEAGFADYISKPVNINEFQETIKKYAG